MGNKHVPFESLAELRATTWRSVLDVISQEGLVFRRRPHPIWFYVFVSLAILFAFAAPLAGRGWESIPVDVIGLGALVIAGVAAVARAIDVAWDATIVVDDNGVEIWRGGSKRVSAAWGEAAAVGLLNMLQRDALDLPGEFKGRDFVVALMNWCRENRTEIAAAGGSLNRTVEAMAHGSGLHFNFDWWDKALSSTLLIGLFLGVLVLIGVAASQESLASLGALEILASIALTVVFGGLALLSALDWKDAGLKITISTQDVVTNKHNRATLRLTWDQIVKPAALKRRRDDEALVCGEGEADTLFSETFRFAPVLAELFEHLLIQEINRRAISRSMTPVEVRGPSDS